MKTTLFLTLILTLVCFHIAYAEVVEIPDSNLEALIRGTIGKPTGNITDIDLQGITRLDSEHDWDTPEEEKIMDFTGLEYCTNLTTLNLSSNNNPLSYTSQKTHIPAFGRTRSKSTVLKEDRGAGEKFVLISIWNCYAQDGHFEVI